MTKILIVGLGGIGSWLVDRLNWLISHEQLIAEIHGYDPDIVEEKNMKYQMFSEVDLYENKAIALDIRFDAEPRWFYGHEDKVVDASVFEGYNLVISAVDNLKFRKLMYEECPCFWIDLRSEGRTIMAISKHPQNTVETLQDLVKGDLEQSGSCQVQADLDAGRIQLGNQIIAGIGAQLILNWYRDVSISPKFIHIF